MKHKDRVIAALNREATDRVPFQATFNPEFANRLRAYFGLEPLRSEPHHRQWYGYELEILTGQDALQVGVGWFTNYYLKDEPYMDDWGVQWKIDPYETPFGKGIYTNIKKVLLLFFGGMAVQSTLPMGTPADIHSEFEWLESTLGKNGGWLCAPTHHVQQDTPVENFLELVKCLNF